MRHAMLALVVLLLGGPAAAQTSDLDPDSQAVIQAVRTQLRWLGQRNVEALAGTFTEDAVIIVSRQRDDAFVNSVTPVREWLDRARANRGGTPFEEPIANIQVTVDSGHLAHLRADFEIVVDGTVRSSGVDQFTLVKEPDGWKVAVIAYTSIPAGF